VVVEFNSSTNSFVGGCFRVAGWSFGWLVLVEGCWGRVEVAFVNLGDNLADPLSGVVGSDADKHVRLLGQAVAAEAAGFDLFLLGEHHFSDYVFSSPVTALAAVAQVTSRIRLGTGVSLLPARDPVFVAEEFATLDVLSGGRAEIAVGRGIFSNVYESLGLSMDQSVEILDEFVELLQGLLGDEPVTWKGKWRPPVEGLVVRPRPLQVPIPLWTASSSPSTIELSARLGLAVMWIGVVTPVGALTGLAERYLAAWAEAGRAREDAQLGLAFHYHVARTSQEARARFWPHYKNYFDAVTPPGVRAKLDLESIFDSVAVCGSSAEVVERIEERRDRLGLTRVVLAVDMGGLGEEEVMEVIELTGAEVLPALGCRGVLGG